MNVQLRVCQRSQSDGSALQPALFLVLRNDSKPSAGLLKDCKICNLRLNFRLVKVVYIFLRKPDLFIVGSVCLRMTARPS